MEIKKYETIDEIFVGPMGIIYKMTIKKKKMKKKIRILYCQTCFYISSRF